MINLKSFIQEASNKPMTSRKFLGKSTDQLMKMKKDNRKYSPAQRDEIHKEIQARQFRENAIAGAPGNNTQSGPGMGSDNTTHMKKMRDWKAIWRRHRLPKNLKKK